ncbi:MAG: PfkB family carbohydrate kinase [Ilumatobacteraceae bacterium]
MSGGGAVTVVGDLVEDVVVWLTGPVTVGTDNPAAVRRSPGGSAANVAAAVARAGGRARFVGRVGDDGSGDVLAAQLGAAGVDVRVQRGGRTGTVVVLVDPDGERTMFPDRGAAAALQGIDPAWLDGTAVLHVPAYGLQTAATVLVDAARTVRAAGGAVTVDVSATSVVDALGAGALCELFGELAPAIVFANHDEAVALGVIDTCPPWPVVVKRGPQPALVVRPDGSITEVPAVAVDRVRDTTGAGDAFAGGFLAAWTAGAGTDLVAACAAGHAAAAAVLGRAGAR